MSLLNTEDIYMTKSEKLLIEYAIENANFFASDHEKEVKKWLEDWGYTFNDECKKYLDKIDWYCY